jgi:hypothetical protein
MTTIALTPSAHRAITGLALTLVVALLSGCGGAAGSSTAQVPVVTLTVTPTVTAVAPPPTAATPKAGVARSDVVGRTFDLGTIVKVEDDGGVRVIIFDRWTARGASDATLAAKGVPIGVHSDAPYQNVNNKITYRIPVVDGAVFTYRHCVAADQPPHQKASTLEDFARLQDPEKVMLLTLDPHGQVFSAQNDPAC